MDRAPNIIRPQRKKQAATLIALEHRLGQILHTSQAQSITVNPLLFLLGDMGAVRRGAWKLVSEQARTGQPPALYHLPSDIGETQDLATTQPSDVDSLEQLYAQWDAQTISPLWRNVYALRLQPLVLAGDWNAFNKSDSTLPWRLTRVTAPAVPGTGTPDAFNWFTNTVHVVTSAGDTTPGTH